MAEYTLAQFLARMNLLTWFRMEVAPLLVYLRSILGDSFFDGSEARCGTEEEGTFLSAVGEGWRAGITPRDDLCIPITHPSSGSWVDFAWADSDYETDRGKVDTFNLGAVMRHLVAVEQELLAPGDGVAGVRSSLEGAPLIHGTVPPFLALLDEGQVNHGKGGRPGGYDSQIHTYTMPVYGEERVFPREAFDRALIRLKPFARRPSDDYIILAGDKFRDAMHNGSSEAFPVTLGMTSGDAFYNGLPSPGLQLRVKHSPLMPANAVYLINRKQVALLAAPLCKVRTERSGMLIGGARSRIHHSLLHQIDERIGRGQEKCHFAFLAVMP